MYVILRLGGELVIKINGFIMYVILRLGGELIVKINGFFHVYSLID
jgi:hypothetical protein